MQKQKQTFRQNVNLSALLATLGNEDKCQQYLEALRWPSGLACLRCGSTTVYRLTVKERPLYQCNSCDYQFSVTAGTVMHDSHLPLSKWLTAVYLITESKKGVSANQLGRMLSVSYKTAWYLCHRIRAAMKEATPAPLSGVVEVDETYVGGKARNMHKSRVTTDNKTIVAGAVQRGGNIRLQVVKGTDRQTLHDFIHSHVDPATGAIYTDQWPAYIGIGDGDTVHESVNHSADEYVRGDVHTNTVEGAWSLFKRSIVGSYHKVSTKHLDAYLDEFEFRFNNRENPYLFRDTLIKLLEAERVEYKRLIG